jgi:nitrogen PTS system EIIA component
MIDIADVISPEGVLFDLKSASKRQVLQELADRAAALTHIDAERLLEALMERERLGTTGVGDGIAIPHAKVAGLDRVVGLFARLDRPVDFDALDDRPVDLVFLLLAPEGTGAEHLKALARVARCLRDAGLCSRLRQHEDAAAVYRLLTRKPESHAA